MCGVHLPERELNIVWSKGAGAGEEGVVSLPYHFNKALSDMISSVVSYPPPLHDFRHQVF